MILCGGSYNSPQLLLLSGIGPADEIAEHGITPVHELPAVGKNLSEHVVFHIQFAIKQPVTFLSRLRADRVALSVLQWALFRKGDFATQALTALAFLRSRPMSSDRTFSSSSTRRAWTPKSGFPGSRRRNSTCWRDIRR